ncbi:flagellar protein FlgN [Acidaminobacter sp. JC074]|uniref:flagellar protein FlgN n=1 Tax=Acidaminobacter sp. JC074 TaxID=2530199 RepID=UPI001F1046ED|nr:flagellar protein FlgN [Acidaminobacter sp. JC074]MCH4889301.1 flagellar protein FlgN [Acidaminobacter sp. JC074]
MSKMIDQLILALRKEQEIYDEIILLAKEKQAAIVNNNLTEIQRIMEKEKTYSISLVKLEQIRAKMLSGLVKEYNLVEINALTDLYPFMSDHEVRNIDGIRTKLVNTVKILSQKNDLNRQLLEQSIEQIQFDLNLMTTVGEGNVNYEHDANDMDVERKSIFDRKI